MKSLQFLNVSVHFSFVWKIRCKCLILFGNRHFLINLKFVHESSDLYVCHCDCRFSKSWRKLLTYFDCCNLKIQNLDLRNAQIRLNYDTDIFENPLRFNRLEASLWVFFYHCPNFIIENESATHLY